MVLEPLSKFRLDAVERTVADEVVREISEAGLADLLARANSVQQKLSSIPVEERLSVIGKIGQIWSDMYSSGELRGLRESLSKSTGYSQKMIDLELSLVPSVLNFLSMKRNLESSFPFGISCLDRFVSIGPSEFCWCRPRGPVFIISSGNSMIPPLIPTTISLATGNMTLLRPSLANLRGVVAVYSLLKEISGDVSEMMQEALAISYFTHDSPSLEYLLSKSKVGVINFWGGEPARTEISKRVASNPNHPSLIINGPLTGYALIDSASADDSAAEALAKNILLYDQQLCSSPTEGAFIGEWEKAIEFAKRLGEKLELLSAMLPPSMTDYQSYLLEGARRLLQFRGSFVLKSASSNSWTVVLSKEKSVLDEVLQSFPEFTLYRRRRFIEIIVVDDFEDAFKCIEAIPLRKSFKGIDGVQSVGLRISGDAKEFVCRKLAEMGIYRILPLEDMYMRSAVEPYDGLSLAQAFTRAVYRRDVPLQI